ncbi:nucleotide sugar dehydrogenase [Aurantimonas sp. A2-1-M11]|uniref:nucleotide sugar dehydrogenase n=1 Tax=Aurantimonas sp. A2-1-M11 TaxID=3113712 RepID=UPI002F92738F
MIKQSEKSMLSKRICTREARIGVIGLGYVGLPLAVACARAGFTTVGFDIDDSKVSSIRTGRSYIDSVGSGDLSLLTADGMLTATSEFSQLGGCDVIVICVPTPLSKNREPDLTFVESTAHVIAGSLRCDQLVILESTTYPGTTEEVLRPILEKGGLKSGQEFFLGFSPEREDPGNLAFKTVTIPKVVAGDGPQALKLVEAFYGAVVESVVSVSSPKVAEAVKITENVFRSVNIALVNELKIIYDAMGIDVWEVIEAASTKPFGYMPFYPGPGLGGHCIPIDPFYLTWKSREYNLPTRFIELSGEINLSMPKYVVGKLENALDEIARLSLGSAKILVLGIAYKKNVSDIRESPSFAILELLAKRGVSFGYHDPHVGQIPSTREHPAFTGLKSVNLDVDCFEYFDAVLVLTDHDAVDYELVVRHARIIVDTRNVFGRRGLRSSNIRKA